jgi:hypothetical protein
MLASWTDAEVVIALVVSCSYGTELLEFAEEALEEIAVSIDVGAEGRPTLAVRHGLDVGPGATCCHLDPERVAVIGTVGKQHIAIAEGGEHIDSAAAIMRLAGGELERSAGRSHRPAHGSCSSSRRARDPCNRVPLFAAVGTVLMNPDRRRGDHLRRRRKPLTPLPMFAASAPLDASDGSGSRRSYAVHSAPGCPPRELLPQPPEDAVQNPAIVHSLHPAHLRR